ncbi:MAG: DUF3048 domain-containing protein [Actinobacteria bacterium]|nr:DUF3048 domain-containing protein [Actinomycetota bacterium]
MFENLSRQQKILLGVGGGAVAVALIAVVLSVAGGGDESAPTTTTTTTTTTIAPGQPAPLTGLPASDAAVFSRPAVAGKIGNNPEARPQVGLNDADIVVEEEVEGRITRFLAVFHSTLPERFGPVRSVRVQDPLIVQPVGGIFGYSGGAAGVVNQVVPQLEGAGISVFDESKAAGVGATVLDNTHGNHVRPNILFYFPNKLIEAVGSTTPPNPIFSFLADGEPFAGEAASTVTIPVGPAAYNPTWTWDAAAKVWKRAYGTNPFLTNGDQQVVAQNLIVQFVGTGDKLALGTGEAWVFCDGKFIKGTWSRDTEEGPTKYVDSAGAEIKLTPGRTWVALPLQGGAVRVG